MKVSTANLTEKERQVYRFIQTKLYVTGVSVCENVNEVSYTSATRFLNSLAEKGYVVKSRTRYEDGYRYSIPKVNGSDKKTTLVPFKGEYLGLEDLLLYITQDTGKVANDFQKYGTVIASAINHLTYRAMQLQSGLEPNSPGPREVKEFLEQSLKVYRDFIYLIKTIIELPIFDNDTRILDFYESLNQNWLNEAEEKIFLPVWKQGIASRDGIKEKFSQTIREMKTNFEEEYGESVYIHEQ